MAFHYNLPQNPSADSRALAKRCVDLWKAPQQGATIDEELVSKCIELLRLRWPKHYDGIKAALKWNQPAEVSKITADTVAERVIFLLNLLPMAFEYWFPSQATIPGYAAIPFSVVSVLLNTSLNSVLLKTFLKSGMLNVLDLVNDMRASNTLLSAARVPVSAFIRGITPDQWTVEGAELLASVYGPGYRSFWEKCKPIPSFLIKAFAALVGGLSISLILFQNSENAFNGKDGALEKQPWLREIFSYDSYDKYLVIFNYLTILLNWPLYSIDLILGIGKVFDTDMHALAAKQAMSDMQRVLEFVSDDSKVATISERQSLLSRPSEQKTMLQSLWNALTKLNGADENMAFITSSLGPTAQDSLQYIVKRWIVELTDQAAQNGGVYLTPVQMQGGFEQLEGQCAVITNPFTSKLRFKASSLLAYLSSLISTLFYCAGIAPLYLKLLANEKIPRQVRAMYAALGAGATGGPEAFSYLSVGPFSLIHSAHGFRKFFYDGWVMIGQAEGVGAKESAAVKFFMTICLVGLSAATPAFEASSGQLLGMLALMLTIMGAIKGFSVNWEGAAYMVKTAADISSTCCTRLRPSVAGAWLTNVNPVPDGQSASGVSNYGSTVDSTVCSNAALG